jgi:DNA-binding protein HU-beta
MSAKNANSMTKAALIESIAQKAECSKSTVEMVLKAMDEVVKKALKDGTSVPVAGLGKLRAVMRKERTGRNPRTGQAIKIPARTVPVFTPGQALKDAC